MGRKLEVATSLNIASTTDSEENFTPKLLFKAPVRTKCKKIHNSSILKSKPPSSMKPIKKEIKSQSLAKQQQQNRQTQIQMVINSQKEAIKNAPKVCNKLISQQSQREKERKKEKSKIDESRSKPSKNIDNIIQESLMKEFYKKKSERQRQQQEEEEKKKRLEISKNIGAIAREKIPLIIKADNDSATHKAPWGVDQRKYKPIATAKNKPISEHARLTYSPPARSISKASNDKIDESILPKKKKKEKRKGIEYYIKVKHSRVIESLENEKEQRHKKKQKIRQNLLKLSNYAKKVATTYKSAEKPKESKKHSFIKKSKTPQNFYERYIKMFSQLDADVYNEGNIQLSKDADKKLEGKEVKQKLSELAQRYQNIKSQNTRENNAASVIQKYYRKYSNSHESKSHSVISGVVKLNIVPQENLSSKKSSIRKERDSSEKKVTHLSIIQKPDEEEIQDRKADEDDEIKQAKDLDNKLSEELASMQHQLFSSDISEGEKNVLLQYIKKTKSETKLESREIQTEERKLTNKPSLSILVSDLNDSKSEDVKPQSAHKKPDDLFNSASVVEMRMMCGNEKLVRENSLRISQTPKSCHMNHNSAKFKWETERSIRLYDIAEEQEHFGPFDRNSFNEFTFKKFQDILKEDNLTKIIKIRENAYKFKEQAEKNYIKNMFESRQLSPKTYFSKRMEIEKWVHKEKEDIKRSKKQIQEQYSKAQKMIEDAHDNAVRIKKLMSNSSFPEQTNTHPAEVIEKNKEEEPILTINEIENPPISNDPEDEIDRLADQLDKDIASLIESQGHNNFPDTQIPNADTKSDTKNVLETPPEQLLLKEKEQNTDAITSEIMKDLLKELMTNLFPVRKPNEVESSGEVELVSNPKLFDENKGIRVNKESVGEFLDIVIEIIISAHPEVYEIVTTPKDYSMIAKLGFVQSQCNEIDFFKLLIENTQILNEEIFIEANNVFLERMALEAQILIPYQATHNRVVFDALNEALNLLRPYGKFGEPPTWSTRQRSAYLQSEDASFIYSNAREIVLEYVTMEAGVLPCREYMANGKFDEEYFAEAREKHLANVLGQEVLDIEDLWINYENEEAQVKMDIADMILDGLVTETVQILNKAV